MLQKHPKPQYIRTIRGIGKILFVAEAFLFVGAYGVWHRMNTSRDFRLYMHKNYNWALEGYYSFGEYMSDDSTRTQDINIWMKEGKVSN